MLRVCKLRFVYIVFGIWMFGCGVTPPLFLQTIEGCGSTGSCLEGCGGIGGGAASPLCIPLKNVAVVFKNTKI